jgi:hypothetical protein
VGDHRVDLGGPGDVGLDRAGVAAGLFDQFRRLLVALDIGDDDPGAFLGELQRRGAADAGAGAGYERYLSRNECLPNCLWILRLVFLGTKCSRDDTPQFDSDQAVRPTLALANRERHSQN